jgi:hypothetical protein
MDHRIGYRRPLRTAALLRKKRLRARLCIGAAIAIAAVTAACTWEPGTAAPAGKTAATPLVKVALNSSAPSATPATRRIYPYSIVPGGVATREDIVARVKADGVVAQHYATFDIKKARAITNDKARPVHVSYRKGDKVYWTAKTVMLTPGETLLTDGSNEIRGRCGNRISTKAMLPVAMNEPTAAELDESMNVAPDAVPDGGLENTGFAFDDAMPAGNPTAFTSFPGFPQSNAGPVDPVTRSGMPSAPFSAPSGSGLLPTRYLTPDTEPGGTVAITAPPDAGATPVTPAAPVATVPDVPATPVTPATPATPVTPVTPDAPVTPATPVTPDTPAVPVTPVHVDTPVTPEVPAAPPAPVTPTTPVTPTADPLPHGDIPEPGTLWLVGAALAILYMTRRKTPPASRR